MKQFFLLIACSLFFIRAISQAGNLDPSFGNNGSVVAEFTDGNNYPDKARQVLVQNDGKLLVAVELVTVAGEVTLLIRYNTDGTIDHSFGGLEHVNILAGKVALQSDGKIVVAGYRRTGVSTTDFALVRYHGDGTLDITFSGDGQLTTDIGTEDYARAVTLQPDGKVVVAGYTRTGGNSNFALVRYNANGSLDNSFSDDGKQTTDLGSSDDIAYSMALQGDGKIVLAGQSTVGTNLFDFAIARYNVDGILDNTFDQDGIVTTHFGSANDVAYSVAMQGDEKIVAAGYTSVPQISGGFLTDFGLARYNGDGSLDASFSDDGLAITDFGSFQDEARSVIIQPDGKIIAVGRDLGNSYDFALARYNPNGTLDNTFSGDGKQITDFGAPTGIGDEAFSVALQGDGKIVVAGQATLPLGGSPDYALTRYNTDGTLDNAFSGDGIEHNYRLGFFKINSIVVQADGKIVAAGFTTSATVNGKNGDFAIVRYNVDGSLDNSFSGDGMVTTNFGPRLEEAYSVALQADGKILVAGYSQISSSNNDFALVRYNPDGTLDNTFSDDGKLTTDFGNARSEEARSIVIQADGKIILAGYVHNGTNLDFAIARYNPDGSLDNTFSSDGVQVTDFASQDDEAFSAALQADGKIVVAGSTRIVNNIDFGIVRYNADGSLDNSFSEDGKQNIDINLTFLDVARSVVIQLDGRIVLAGQSSSVLTGGLFALARCNQDGSTDNTFSGDGSQTTDFGSTRDDIIHSVNVQTDGKIVAIGQSFDNGAYNTDFVLARYTTDGSLDNTFSDDGKQITHFAYSDVPYSSTIHQNRLYVGGVVQFPPSKGVVAAYQIDVINPVQISCPGNQTILMDQGVCTALVTGIDPVINPPGTNETVNYTLNGATSGSGTGSASGQNFNKGITTVNYSLASDQSKTCSFTVTIVDNQNPVLICPSIPPLCNNSSGIYTIPPLIATDNCGVQNITYSVTGTTTRNGSGTNASGTFNAGESTITWTVSDVNGNTETCQATVLVLPLLTVVIPDAQALSSGVNLNTVYIGYTLASQITLNAQPSGGIGNYTYSWMPTGSTASSLVIDAATLSPGSYTYTVTVTDEFGCTGTATKQIIVKDIRCGNDDHKVNICHITDNDQAHLKVLCIDENGVPAHLAKGCKLGDCTGAGSISNSRGDLREQEEGSLKLKATPNPSNNFFTIKIQGKSSSGRLSLKVFDLSGRLIELKHNLSTGQTIQLGNNYRAGTYIIEISQGVEKVQMRLVKLTD